MFVQVSSKVLEYFFVGDNVRPLFQFATVGAQGGSERGRTPHEHRIGAIDRVASQLASSWRLLCAFHMTLYAAGPLSPVKSGMGPRGERARTVFRASVRVYRRPCPLPGGASFAWAMQHVGHLAIPVTISILNYTLGFRSIRVGFESIRIVRISIRARYTYRKKPYVLSQSNFRFRLPIPPPL